MGAIEVNCCGDDCCLAGRGGGERIVGATSVRGGGGATGAGASCRYGDTGGGG